MKKENITKVIERYANQIKNLMTDYGNYASVSYEALVALLTKHFPEIIAPNGHFNCALSFNSYMNAYRRKNDFPDAYSVYLKGFSEKQISEIKESYKAAEEEALLIFVNDIKKHAA